MRTSDLHQSLSAAILELAWRQWAVIGVAGALPRHSTIVDPEALVLATLSVGRADARLFDEMLDWVSINARVLDMARLRRLGKRATDEQHRLLGVVAEVAIEHGAKSNFSQIGWAGLIAQEERGAYESVPLFDSQGDRDATWAPPDPRFASAGFLRPSPILRGMSRTPDATRPACLRFRARALVGPGAKAEVLTYLWTHEWAHGRLLAERAAYNQASVADYLASLAEAGLADRRSDGRRTLYRLAQGLRILGEPVPIYVDWTRVWPALDALSRALRPAGLSEAASWVRLAEALGAQSVALSAEGFEIEIAEVQGWARKGSEYLVGSAESAIARVRQLSE